MKHSLAAQMQTTLAPVVKKRVAAYARVSTEHEEQQTSYDAQVDYYTQKIKERTDWVFVEVYTEMLTNKVYPMSRTTLGVQVQKPEVLWYNDIALPAGRIGQR